MIGVLQRLPVLALALCLVWPAAADEVDDPEFLWDLSEVGLTGNVMLDASRRFRDRAPLWSWVDPKLEANLRQAVDDLGMGDAVRRHKLAVALVDITHMYKPRVALLNGDDMVYAASLPKIGVLLAAFEKIASGELVLDSELESELTNMIRFSSNEDTTAVMTRLGKPYIARVLLSRRYRLYDPVRNGGLWVGKDYAKGGLWRRDPLKNLSHGATAAQVARFYYLLETGNLVTPEYSQRMKSILGNSAILHKFARGLSWVHPDASIYRKSGSWHIWHADGGIVEREDGHSYIAVALTESSHGGEWLPRLLVAMDRLIAPPGEASYSRRSSRVDSHGPKGLLR